MPIVESESKRKKDWQPNKNAYRSKNNSYQQHFFGIHFDSCDSTLATKNTPQQKNNGIDDQDPYYPLYLSLILPIKSM